MLTRRAPLLLGLLAGPTLLSCAEEELRKAMACEVTEDAFATDAFSAFESIYTLGDQTGADAIVVTSPRPTDLPTGATWHLTTVDVLVARTLTDVPQAPRDPGGDLRLAVDIWEGDDPRDESARRWSLEQTVDPATLTWSAVDRQVLIESIQQAQGRVETAPWRFDFSSQLSELNMTASTYTIAVRWLTPNWPLVAVSDFKPGACSRNWVRRDAEAGRFMQPQTTTCSLPMFKVASRTLGGVDCE